MDCAFEECTQLGFDMFGFAQHVHNFWERLFKTRMNARGHRRNAQRPLHPKNHGFIHAQTDGGCKFDIAHVCTLYSFAGIDDNSRETLKYIKQGNAATFEIAMGTIGKLFK